MQVVVERRTLAQAVDETLERLDDVARLGDVGAQVVQRVAHLADDAADVGAQLLQRRAHGLALGIAGHEPIELERQVGQRLSDAVVQIASDTCALFVRADRAQPAEPASVVDREGHGLDEALQHLDVAAREVILLAMLEGEQPDDRTACREHRVQAAARVRRQPFELTAIEVVHFDQLIASQAPA